VLVSCGKLTKCFRNSAAPDVEPSDSESSGSDWDNHPMPDVVVRPPLAPVSSLVIRGTQTMPGDGFGATGGANVNNRSVATCGLALAATRGLSRGKRGDVLPKMSTNPAGACGLCTHGHIFKKPELV